MNEKEIIKKYGKFNSFNVFILMIVVTLFLLTVLFGLWRLIDYMIESSGIKYSKIISTSVIIIIGIIIYILKKK